MKRLKKNRKIEFFFLLITTPLVVSVVEVLKIQNTYTIHKLNALFASTGIPQILMSLFREFAN